MSIFIVDSDRTISQGGKIEDYWLLIGWKRFYKIVRPGFRLPKDLQTNDVRKVISKFKLHAVGYGNWTTVEDRINYTNSLIYCLFDLNKVLKFGYNIGFGSLGITFGARGSGRALAHYEPGSDIINISRYHRGRNDKEIRFLGTGGMGSFAHEYGHFLDYWSGSHIAKNKNFYSLSNGDSISTKPTATGNRIRNLMDEILDTIIWEDRSQKKFTKYYERLKTFGLGDYWYQRNEIFARAFEVYVSYKLNKEGITNLLLAKNKYINVVYIDPKLTKKVLPVMDKLISEIRKKIK